MNVSKSVMRLVRKEGTFPSHFRTPQRGLYIIFFHIGRFFGHFLRKEIGILSRYSQNLGKECRLIKEPGINCENNF